MKKTTQTLLAGAFAAMMTAQPAAAQDKKITDVIGAARALDPIERRLKAEINLEEDSKALLELQKSLEIFGEGPEVDVTFTHKGTTYTVPIDFDAGTLRFSRETLYWVNPTSKIIEPAHEAIMRGITNMSAAQRRQEDTLSGEARAAFIPLDHADAKGYKNHLKDVHGFDVEAFWQTYIVPELEDFVKAKSQEFRDIAMER